MRGERSYWIRLIKLTLVALGVGVTVGVVGYVVLASARYTHAVTHPGCRDAGISPTDLGIPGARDVTYATHDGLTLRAWYLPPENGVVIILLPGLGGGRDGMLNEAAVLARHGYGFLSTELRSCAHPEGETTLGKLEAQDLPQAVSWTLAQPGVSRVGVLGFSLGGVTAILGSAEDERIEAVLAEGGFHDLTAEVTNPGGDDPVWKALIYRVVLVYLRIDPGVDAGEVSPISVVDGISPRPLLLIYGEDEPAAAHARALLDRAAAPKELWFVPDCGHGGYLAAAPAEWERRVIAHFDRAFGEESRCGALAPRRAASRLSVKTPASAPSKSPHRAGSAPASGRRSRSR